MSSDGALSELPRRLATDQVLQQLLGKSNAQVAVAQAARAFFVAGVTKLSDRNPIVAVTSTISEAEMLANDLRIWLSEDEVETFPAWETLPFERVSPTTATMGKRLELINKIQEGRAPRVILSPIRALLQRINPEALDIQPLKFERGAEADLSQLAEALVLQGYRRELQVEGRGEFSIRGGILDVFPSTGTSPIRLDLWGDQIDRLSEFSIADQRSIAEIESITIAPARELTPTTRVRQCAQELKSAEPWGKEQWDRLASGEFYDGMESWLPWLVDEELILADLLAPRSLVLFV